MEDKKQELIINFRCIFSDVLKNLWIIIIASATIAMGTFLYTESVYSDVYTSSATYAVTAKGNTASIYSNLATAKSIAEVMTDIFSSDTLKNMIAKDLGVKRIPGTINAELIPESTLINITVNSSSPEMAFKIMKSAVKHYPEISDYVVSNAVLDTVSEPSLPTHPSNRFTGKESMKKAFELSFVVLLVGFIAMSIFSDRVKNEKDAQKRLDAKLFGVVPVERKKFSIKKNRKSILITNIRTSFYFVEQLKVITTKLEYALKNKNGKTIAFTSLLENEGKSTVVSNIAIALGQRGKKVLLLDADLRKPAIYKVFDRQKDKNDGGLADYLNGLRTEDEIITYEEDLNIYMICGRKSYGNSAELLSSQRYSDLITNLKEKFDYIVIDSSPIALTADSEIIADSADGILLIVRQNTAPAAMVNDAIDDLSDCNAKLLGFILNRANGSQAFGGESYGGRYGYGYGYGHKSGYGGYGGYGSYSKYRNSNREGDE